MYDSLCWWKRFHSTIAKSLWEDLFGIPLQWKAQKMKWDRRGLVFLNNYTKKMHINVKTCKNIGFMNEQRKAWFNKAVAEADNLFMQRKYWDLLEKSTSQIFYFVQFSSLITIFKRSTHSGLFRRKLNIQRQWRPGSIWSLLPPSS